MARSSILFQQALSLPGFQRFYGNEEQCEAALEKARWPDEFRCPRCNRHEHGLVYGRRLKRYQCRNCGHQATLTADKVRWIITLLGNLRTSSNGTFNAFNFGKYARRSLCCYCFRFNRRFSLAAKTQRIANAVCCCMPRSKQDLRIEETYG